jgi:hypothetical protein
LDYSRRPESREEFRRERETKMALLIRQGFLRTEHIKTEHIKASRLKLPGKEFIPFFYWDYAYEEIPLPPARRSSHR